MSLSRKDFLRQGILSLGQAVFGRGGGGAGERPRPLRPPHFREEAAEECSGCTACRDACPGGIIVRDDGVGGPVLDFGAGRCTFCSLCADACPRGVLALPAPGERTPLGTAMVDRGRCLVRGGCFTCSERCPEGAITPLFGSEIRVSASRCSGCGACEHACPVEPKAIRVVSVRGTV